MLILTTVLGAMIVSFSGVTVGDVELVSEGHTFTEGPLWLPGDGLIYSDVSEDTIFRQGGTVFRMPSNNTNGMALDPEGHLVVCESERHRLTITGKDGDVTELVSEYEGKRLNSPNDVVVRSDGLILFTDPKPLRGAEDMPMDFSGVYSFNPETKTIKLLTSSMKFPNGIGLSPDEQVLYVSDTSGGVIKTYDLLGDGTVENERIWCEVRIPDGIVVDSEGKVWSSSSSGISVYDAKGTFLERIRVPIMPTNCTFGGREGNVLYITARKKVFSVITDSHGQGKY